MSRLEDLTPNTSVRGILPNGLVTVVNVQWHGSAALELTYKTPEGKVANELLYRHDESRIEVVEQGRPWSFDGDGALFRLVSEAQRINGCWCRDRQRHRQRSSGRHSGSRDKTLWPSAQARSCAVKSSCSRVLLPTRLRMELDRVPLWRGDHVAIKQLVEDFARYLYLPRIKEPGVLLQSIRDGLGLLTWSKDSFAFAESYDEAAGRYRGLRCGQMVAVSLDDTTSLLVKPEIAQKQTDTETSDALGQPPEVKRWEHRPAARSTATGGEAAGHRPGLRYRQPGQSAFTGLSPWMLRESVVMPDASQMKSSLIFLAWWDLQ